jgi:pimeloyl-ACP methyl ester carboxylesterase
VALQLAHCRQEMVGSLVLLEPALPQAENEPPEMQLVSAATLLLVGGAGDRLGTPHRARAAHIAAHLPHAKTRVLDGLTHAMPLEDPVLVACLIAEFLAGQPLYGESQTYF